MMRSHRYVGCGLVGWRIFHLFRMRRYWLVNHPLSTFSSRPSRRFSLSLDMPRELFHALSPQGTLRNHLSPVCFSLTTCSPVDRHAWLYPLPFPNRNLFSYQTLTSKSPFQQICLPNHHISQSQTALSLYVQHIFRLNSGGIVFWWKPIQCCLCLLQLALDQLNGYNKEQKEKNTLKSVLLLEINEPQC